MGVWVYTENQKEDGSKVLNERLVAMIFEEKSMKERTDSSLCSSQALTNVFVLASIFA